MEDQSHNYNWVSVISFIQKQYSKNTLRQKQWLFERNTLKQKIDRLQSQLLASQTIQTDLLNRIRLLEISLTKYKTKVSTDHIVNVNNKQEKTQNNDIKYEQKHSILQRMMTDLGLTQNLTLNYLIPQTNKMQKISQAFNNKVKIKSQMQLKLCQKNYFSAHLDSVQQMHKSTNSDFLGTVSQDCLLKIWNFKEVLTNNQVEPVMCLRQHTGPLFCISGGRNPFNSDEQLLFTGGSEGCVKIWKVQDVNMLQRTALIGSWNNSNSQDYDQHAVWQLDFRNSNSKLLSSSSDGSVRLFKIQQNYQTTNQITGSLQRTFKEKNFLQTAIQWATDHSFFSGCSNAPRANLWDIQGRICQKFLFEGQKNKEPQLSQINCLDYLNVKKTLCLGCQDSYIRIFDLNSGRIVKRLKLNSSVSCITAISDWQIACGCHSGGMQIWDLRLMEIIFEDSNTCLKKYDEGVKDIITDRRIILTSGSDGTIKVYS